MYSPVNPGRLESDQLSNVTAAMLNTVLDQLKDDHVGNSMGRCCPGVKAPVFMDLAEMQATPSSHYVGGHIVSLIV